MAHADSIVAIYEQSFSTKGAVHAYLASMLDFPSYYGANLDALVDCLGDISTPTLIVLVRSREEGRLSAWFDKLALAIMVSVRENPALDAEIVFG